MSLGKKYYTLPKAEFESYLEHIKKDKETIHLYQSSDIDYFFYPETRINDLLLKLNKIQWEFDSVMNSFSEFGKKQILQSFFLDEIQSTNAVEQITSTKQDILCVLDSVSKTKDRKIVNITKSYRLLSENKVKDITSLEDIRKIYDFLLLDTLPKEDIPDGRIFRKNPVYLTDGIKSIHTGFYPEEEIEKGMSSFLNLNHRNMDIFLKVILSHFLFESIHPFYDGNGRLGRFLFSSRLYQETKSYLSFLISKIINSDKKAYYSSFKKAESIHEFSSVNKYVFSFSNLLLSGFEKELEKLKEKKKQVDSIQIMDGLTKSEKKIYSILKEGTLLSEFGIKLDTIIKETHVSRRTCLYALSHFEEKDWIKTTRLGKWAYYRIKEKDS